MWCHFCYTIFMNQKIKLAILTFAIYGIPLAVLSFLPFSQSLYGQFHSFLYGLLFNGKAAFSALGLIFDLLLVYCLALLFTKSDGIGENRIYHIFSGLKKLFRYVFISRLRKDSEISEQEKVSLLFYLVKIFFTPVMFSFAINNVNSLMSFVRHPAVFKFTSSGIVNSYFYFIFYLILALDTAIFTFGYLFESKALKNVVKSVEPTALGWIVAIICYPPLNDLTAKIAGWYSADFSNFGNFNLTIVMGVLSLLLFGIYVWASVALGFKASNLTNRGIVSHGPYKYVRHPAYFAKNLSWWIMGLPFIKSYGLIAVVGLAAWSLIYFLRAITEERHLSKDPAYLEYSQRVKHMFIPGVY